MDSQIRTWLFDILQSIEEIESYFTNRPKIFEEYLKDIRTKRAVERNLEIIGGAVNRIRKSESLQIILNADKIVATRNRIIHGYDKISDELIWSILINHIPKLKQEIEELLDN
jgi:uncharacterized protein with HEPN domain